MAHGAPLSDDVVNALRERGFRMTAQRRAIVDEVMASAGHIQPSALVKKVRAEIPSVNPSTVYRTLALLDEVGVLSHAHLEGGVEYHRAERARHVHLTCSNCGAEQSLSDADVEPLSRLMQTNHGFLPDLTHFGISGLCRECQTKGATPRRRPPVGDDE